MHEIELLCSLCGVGEWSLFTDAEAEELKRQQNFYFLCRRHNTSQSLT